MKTTTIKDIAQKAGVSVSTVSRVLNNHPSVKPEKRQLVQQIIQQENFQPSMLARGMISNQTKNIGVLLSDINNPYFTDLVVQIELVSRELGYSLLMLNTSTAGSMKTSDPVQRELNAFTIIMEKKVDGLIILGGEIDQVKPNPRYIESLNKTSETIPTVIVGQANESINAMFLPRAINKGTTLAVQHLLSLGYRNIGFIGGETGITITEERLAAFRQTLSIYSKVNEDWIVPSDFYAQSGYQSTEKLLAMDQLPEAILAINDKVALGAIRCLNDHHLNCPEDLAIVSCDAFLDSEYITPRLTTVDQNNKEIGKNAVQLLMKLLQKDQNIIIPTHYPELIIRESCGIQLKGT